jgi:uncharacterized protein (TIGR02444 family)
MKSEKRLQQEPYWRFAVEVYRKPGVAEVCLQLQDRIGVDVSFMMVLICAFLHRGVSMTDDEIAGLDAAVSDWRSEVVVPLRQMRRRMKAGLFPAPDGGSEELRSKIKAAELHAELLEMAGIWQQLEQASPAAERPDIMDVLGRIVRHSHASGAHARDQLPPETQTWLRTITEAVSEAQAEHGWSVRRGE